MYMTSGFDVFMSVVILNGIFWVWMSISERAPAFET